MFGMLRMRWLFSLLPRTFRYMSDKRVPIFYKILPFSFILFFLTPIARLLALVPVLGLVDEFTILLLSLALFTYLSDKALKRWEARHPNKATTSAQIIEGEYVVVAQTARPLKRKEAEPGNAHELKRR